MMRVLVTGADTALGALLAGELAADNEVVTVGVAGRAAGPTDGYTRVNLEEPEEAQQLLTGVQAIVHAQPHGPRVSPSEGDEELLDRITRGTYVLATTAIEVGVGRMVLISNLNVLDGYPKDYKLSPQYRPRPEALAPFLAELTCREIARTGKLPTICLRFGLLDEVDGTESAAAVEAVRTALTEEMPGDYSWDLRHVSSASRLRR